MGRRLEGRTCFVTGAASGIAAAIARRFAVEGAAVLAADIDGAGAERVAAEIRQSGGDSTAFEADLTSERQVAAAIGHTDTLDVVVNAAGRGQRPGDFAAMSEDDFDRLIAANIKSVLLVTRAALPLLRRSKAAVIINIASSIAMRPRAGYAVYSATKGFVATLTRSLALELAPDRIRVVGINPSATDTPMLVEFMGGEASAEGMGKLTGQIPLGRLVTPDEIAGTAVWLASDDAAMITGDLIAVDGGRGL